MTGPKIISGCGAHGSYRHPKKNQSVNVYSPGCIDCNAGPPAEPPKTLGQKEAARLDAEHRGQKKRKVKKGAAHMTAEQLLLDPRPGRSHVTATKTEKAAANAGAKKFGGQRLKILKAIVDAGEHGCTQWELVERLHLLRSSVCGRFNELEKDDRCIYKTDRTRATHGSSETVYCATLRGQQIAKEAR